MSQILVIDDDRSVRHLIAKGVRRHGRRSGSRRHGRRRHAAARRSAAGRGAARYSASGNLRPRAVRRAFARVDAKLPVIFITSLASSETAIKAMTLGAFDYLLKPLDLARIRDLVGQALEIRRLMSIPVEMPGARPQRQRRADRQPQRHARRQQPADAGSVQGDRPRRAAGRDGADPRRKRHRQGARRPRRLSAQPAASRASSWPSTAPRFRTRCLESELFGHEKGSFTGADQRRIGKFEQCSGGTLFLDEIGDMSPLVQSKVLRVLQSQQFERVGGNQTITTDVRVIAATNRDLEKMVEEGEFRSDLYYRLSGFTIQLAPLRDRPEDLRAAAGELSRRLQPRAAARTSTASRRKRWTCC